MNWPEGVSGFLFLFGLAFLIHGFPDIKIGGTHTEVNNYYNDEKEEE